MKKNISILVNILVMLMSPTIINAQEETDQLNTNQEIVDFIDHQPGNISFYYENIKTGQQMYYKPDKVFSAASTVKLPMALYVSQQAAKNKVDLNEVKTYKSHHYSGGSGVIQFDDVGSTYTLENIVKKSMTHSDNIAYIMLLERFNRSNLIDFMHDLGGKYAYPDMKNVTTAKDMGLYLHELYEFSNQQELGEELIDYLKNTVFNDAIPSGVPEIDVANKIGYITDQQLYHDIGIVYDEDPYILVILTQGNTQGEEWETIAELTEIVHKKHKVTTLKQDFDIIFNKALTVLINQYKNFLETISDVSKEL